MSRALVVVVVVATILVAKTRAESSAADARNLAELQAASTQVAADAPVEAPPPKVIIGDATSSLSHDQALAEAQFMAARLAKIIPGAGVADLSKEYMGKYSPAIPKNAVYVVEPVNYSSLHAFDLILYTVPTGEMRCGTLLAKRTDTAIVGFAFLDEVTHATIDAKACVGRIVAMIRFDPAIQGH